MPKNSMPKPLVTWKELREEVEKHGDILLNLDRDDVRDILKDKGYYVNEDQLYEPVNEDKHNKWHGELAKHIQTIIDRKTGPKLVEMD